MKKLKGLRGKKNLRILLNAVKLLMCYKNEWVNLCNENKD